MDFDLTRRVDSGLPIKALFLDFDGVFTDNTVFLAPDGQECYKFSKYDSSGIGHIHFDSDVIVHVVSASRSPIVRTRCLQLGIPGDSGIRTKYPHVLKLIKHYGLELGKDGIVYMGNDRADMEVMLDTKIIAAAPADASAEVLDIADIITERAGGDGAIRAVCDYIEEVNKS